MFILLSFYLLNMQLDICIIYLEALDAPNFVLVLHCLSLIFIFLSCARSFALSGLQLHTTIV